MIKKLFLVAITAIVVQSLSFTSISAKELATSDIEIQNEHHQLQNEVGDEGITYDNLKDRNHHSSDIQIHQSTKSNLLRASVNNNPNAATFLSSAYYGYTLTDEADGNDNWYYFDITGNKKIVLNMNQPPNSDYDIYLYKLNDTTLNMVAYSEYGGTSSENLSYVASTGRYYFRIVPYVASNPASELSFYFNVVSSYDAAEADDNVWLSKPFTNSIVVSQTLDNGYDEDWFKLTINEIKDKHEIVLSNVPTNANYAVVVYDANLNVKGSFTTSSSPSKTGYMTFAKGTYYIKIYSVNKVYSMTPYNFSVKPYIPVEESVTLTAIKGQTVKLTKSAVYIDGEKINLNWNYYVSNGALGFRQQSLEPNDSNGFLVAIANNGWISTGTFKDQQGHYYDNVLRIAVSNAWFNHYSTQEGSLNRRYYEPYYTYIFIDVTNKKVVDVEDNVLYTLFGHKYTFTPSN